MKHVNNKRSRNHFLSFAAGVFVMKNNLSFKTGLTALAMAIPLTMNAAQTDISNNPLSTTGNSAVKPNIFFILDDSGSMAASYMPDDAYYFYGRYGFTSPQCNGLAYNPAAKYIAPKKSDGTNYPDASFSAAPDDGYVSNPTKYNLSGSYYYTYTGKQTDKNYADTSSTFYKECVSAIGSDPGKSVFTKVTVAAAEQQNYANWFGYYSTRILMAKTATGRAFSGVGDNYRVGFMTIHTTKNDTSDYVKINDFGSTQKSNWYSKLYSISPGNATPLREALSLAGSMYAGKALDDPIQYSCQQNFAILTTDGYWNGTGGYMEDGSNIGDQDHTDVRPYFDGGKSRYTKTKTDTVEVHSYVTKDSDGNTCDSGRNAYRIDITGTITTIEVIDGVEGTPTTVAITPKTNWKNNGACKKQSKLDQLPPPGSPGPVTVKVDGKWVITKAAGSVIDNTLADVAEYYYKTDLRDSTNSTRTPNCNTGLVGGDVCTDNVPTIGSDTAKYQHMTTFTMGFGVNGVLKYAPDYDKNGSADFNAISQGTKDWPVPVADDRTAVDDLWHAGVNGRGKYFSARDPDAVVKGLADALSGVSARLGAGAAASTSNLEPVNEDNFAYVADYRTVFWDGDLKKKEVDLQTGQVADNADPIWSAQALLDKRANKTSDTRKIYTYSAAAVSKLRDFSASGLTNDEKTKLDPALLSQYAAFSSAQKTAATVDSVINYLRGQSQFEAEATNVLADTSGNITTDNRLYRDREHILGDVINARPSYASNVPPFRYLDAGYSGFKSSLLGRKKTVYLAANDGMLHAFHADTGEELWAYVPSFVLPNLIKLADKNYSVNHTYFVDGSPTIGDVYDPTAKTWRTLLVGGLNAGGKGYYALDVTDPDNPKALWEFTHAQMGLSFGNPLIAKLINGKWIVAVTSGYNNPDGVGRLSILEASSGTLLNTLTTDGVATTPSGLGKISAWVNDAMIDNTIQRIYGGDLNGTLWRFDVNDTIAPSGTEAIALAKFAVGGVPQPITTRPELGLYGSSQIVFVGTGKLLGISDLTNNDQQSLYAVKDTLAASGYGNIRAGSCLVQQQIIRNAQGAISTTVNDVDWSSKCGWYVDFNPSGTNARERVNIDMRLQLGVLTVPTNSPDQSSCSVGGHARKYYFDFATGSYVAGSTNNSVADEITNALIVGLNVYRLPDGKVISTVTTSDDRHTSGGNPDNSARIGGGAGSGKRKSWRQLLGN
jgi:type IV pilus assembly protein PilY1